jgi:hypothetical protein
MAGFTPGPWWTEIDNVFAGATDNSVYVADCAPMGGPVDGRPEQIANARLIAAAPDLLAALQGLLTNTLSNQAPDGQEAVRAARAAIAKATQ